MYIKYKYILLFYQPTLRNVSNIFLCTIHEKVTCFLGLIFYPRYFCEVPLRDVNEFKSSLPPSVPGWNRCEMPWEGERVRGRRRHHRIHQISCNVSLSPTDVSPNESYRTVHPLDASSKNFHSGKHRSGTHCHDILKTCVYL
jgi:hypothetical protein